MDEPQIQGTIAPNALYRLVPLVILGGFLWAEVKIVRLPAHTALIYACIFVEIILVWLWNLLFT